MDDSLEDEIICEMLSAHLHLLWKYVSVTSASISDMAIPTSGESFRHRFFQLGPIMALTLLVIVASICLQSSNQWLQELLLSCQQTIKLKVSDQGLKNLVSATISSDAVSQELQEGIVGVYAMQGRRATMEDRYCVKQDVSVMDDKNISFFGVFDGHGGQYVAEYVKQNLFANTVDKIRELHTLKKDNGGFLRNGIKKNAQQPSSVSPNDRRRSSGSIATPSKPSLSDRRHSLNDCFPSSLESIQENSNKAESEKGPCSGTPKTVPDASTSDKDSASKSPASESSSASSPLGSPGATTATSTPFPNAKDGCPSESAATLETSKEEDHQPLKQKEDPYSNVSSRKRNSIAAGSDLGGSASKEQESASDRDDLYVDSHNNINYTRLLTDQLAHIDNKVVERCKSQGDLSGTTAVLAILDGDLLIIGNVGDSRAVMADIKGSTIPLSFDHKPNQLKESRRIKEAGGFITFTGVWRVAGVLATSRAVGDFPLKVPRKLITAEPDVLTFSLKEHKAHFVILATDGLWDVMTNEGAVAFIRSHIHEYDYGAKSLVKHAYDSGSQDNITVAVINLSKLVK